MSPLTLTRVPYSQTKLEVGTYLVVRKDGKVHKEVYNGTGFAYNDNSIEFYYYPKLY